MSFLENKRDRAALLILLLGVGVTIALWPFLTGLIGAAVLYVVFAPIHQWIAKRTTRGIATIVVLVLAALLILGPGVSFVTLLVNETPEMARAILQSPVIDRLSAIRIGEYQVGEQIRALSSRAVSWMGTGALGLLGTATRIMLQLTITFFGFYYILQSPEDAWRGLRPFIPFSAENSEILRRRFKDVTVSTLIGTFLTALIQGGLVAVGFAVTGLDNPVFWGVVTVIVAILPVVGSGLVWAPGVLVLVLEHRIGWAIGLAAWCIVLVSNIDNVIRPAVFQRYAQIHPFVTVIGAFAGIQYFGLLGLLIGPLAISYFFELIRMYRAEYLPANGDGVPATVSAKADAKA